MEPIAIDMDHPKTPSKEQTCPQAPCNVCRNLRPDIINVENWFTYYGSHRGKFQSWLEYQRLISSKERGCNLCSLILCVSELHSPHKTPTFIEVIVRAKDESLHKFYPLELSLDFVPTGKDWGTKEKEMVFDGSNDEGEEPENEDEELELFKSIRLQLYEEQG